MAFNYLDEEVIKKLITSLIPPKLEYSAGFWSPHKKKDIRKIERIQRAATEIALSLRHLPYEEILLLVIATFSCSVNQLILWSLGTEH